MALIGNKHVLLTIAGAEQFCADRIMLYPEPDCEEIMKLRARAQEELGGFTTGIGFLGSPAWVAGGAALLGVIEGLISNSKSKSGIALLKDAALKYERTKAKGLFFPISEIQGISEPTPLHWIARAVAELRIDLRSLGFMEKAKMMQQYNLTRDNISDGVAWAKSEVNYVQLDSDFLCIEVNKSSLWIRWSSVACYQVKDLGVPI